MKKIVWLFIPLIVFIFQSCVNYTITGDSLRDQLRSMPDSSTTYVNAAGIRETIIAGKDLRKKFNNGIKKFECIDAQGKKISLPVVPKTQLKFTNKKGFSQTFIFETMYLKGEILQGKILPLSDYFIAIDLSKIGKIKVIQPSHAVGEKVK